MLGTNCCGLRSIRGNQVDCTWTMRRCPLRNTWSRSRSGIFHSTGVCGASGRGRYLTSYEHPRPLAPRSEEHTSELQSHHELVCRLLLEKKKYTCRADKRPP